MRKHKILEFTFFHTKTNREIVGHFISIRRNAFWNGNRNISFNCCSIARKDSVKPAKPLINFWKKRATRQFLAFLTKTLIQVCLFFCSIARKDSVKQARARIPESFGGHLDKLVFSWSWELGKWGIWSHFLRQKN